MRKKRMYRPYEGRRGKPLLRALLCALLAGAAVFGALLGQIYSGAKDDVHGAPAVMIILGCQVKPWGPSELLRDRLDTALTYLADHPDMTIVVSGGKGDDEHVSEARCMYDYLVEHGISGERIFMEDQSRNTFQNFLFSRALMEKQDCPLDQGLLIVSNGFHLTRAKMLAGRVGFTQVSTLAAPSSHFPSRVYMFFREPLALIKSFVFDR